MIDQNGHVRCQNCGKQHAIKLEGKLEWYCPRCHFFNRENSFTLDKRERMVIINSKVT